MSRVVALGEPDQLVDMIELVEPEVLEAHDPTEIRAAWAALPVDTGLLILTPTAASVLAEELATRPELLWTVVAE